jgi:hypothetical protein
MKRRTFLERLGLTVAAIAVAPALPAIELAEPELAPYTGAGLESIDWGAMQECLAEVVRREVRPQFMRRPTLFDMFMEEGDGEAEY